MEQRTIKGKKYVFKVKVFNEDDLLTSKDFKNKFPESFNEYFGDIIYSFNRFRLYIYKKYRRNKRGFQLARWIIRKFIELLMDDLIYQNDTFKFPYRNIYLSVKNLNLYRKSYNKRYHARYGDKNYRLFVDSPNLNFNARLSLPLYMKMIKYGKSNPYF